MNSIAHAIPQDIADELCEEIRTQYRGKWWTIAGWQCWGCTTFTKGDPAKMCVHNAPGNRGCNLVNERYDKLAANKSN